MKIRFALVLALFTAACVEPQVDEPADQIAVADREAYTLEQSVSVLTDEPTDDQLTARVHCAPDGSVCCTADLSYCCFWLASGESPICF